MTCTTIEASIEYRLQLAPRYRYEVNSRGDSCCLFFTIFCVCSIPIRRVIRRKQSRNDSSRTCKQIICKIRQSTHKLKRRYARRRARVWSSLRIFRYNFQPNFLDWYFHVEPKLLKISEIWRDLLGPSLAPWWFQYTWRQTGCRKNTAELVLHDIRLTQKRTKLRGLVGAKFQLDLTCLRRYMIWLGRDENAGRLCTLAWL